MKKALRTSFLRVRLMCGIFFSVVAVEFKIKWRVERSALVRLGFLQQSGARPLQLQGAWRVALRAAHLLRERLKARRFLDQQNQLRGLADALAPEIGAPVRLEQSWRWGKLWIFVEPLPDHLEHAALT